MEVHHHAHAGHEKKTWRHYFWEFLMLFLAVFCGFLAEYKLEHTIDKEKGKEYIHSFYEDLKTDTGRVSFLIKYDAEKLAVLNDMSGCYDTITKNWKATSCLIEIIGHSMSNRTFQLTSRTLKQLANAGGYRLLNRADADSIIAYESAFNTYLDFESTLFQEAQDNVRNTYNMLINFKANNELSLALKGDISDTLNSSATLPFLFSSEKVLLNKYFNELLLYKRVTQTQLNLLNALHDRATALIVFFKTMHHLE